MKVGDCLKAIDGELISGTRDKVFRGVSIDSRTLKENCQLLQIIDDIYTFQIIKFQHFLQPWWMN